MKSLNILRVARNSHSYGNKKLGIHLLVLKDTNISILELLIVCEHKMLYLMSDRHDPVAKVPSDTQSTDLRARTHTPPN